MINLSSENFTAVHPEIMKALAAANTGAAPSYGNDSYTTEAIDLFKKQFGEAIDVFFTFNGTGANNFGLGAVVGRHQSIFCSDIAHLYTNESTAPEAFIGCRVYPVASVNGKLVVAELKAQIKKANSIHHPQPKAVSLTQPTEYGTVYSLDELHAIKQVCTEHGMLLHIDGSRFFNAACHTDLSLAGLSRDAGVDILTLGGTKNGMMFGEAILFFNFRDTASFRYKLKRSMQLASKNRFIAVQFTALLQDELWKSMAAHTNSLAKRFASGIIQIPGIKVLYPVESNAVFAELPVHLRSVLQEIAHFYLWEEEKNICRFMFSFDNTIDEIECCIRQLQDAIATGG
jgi:threonine aldolase